MLSKNLASHHDSQGLKSIVCNVIKNTIHAWMFVAVAGLEPAPLDSSTSFSTARCSTMLNYTAYHVYIVIALPKPS